MGRCSCSFISQVRSWSLNKAALHVLQVNKYFLSRVIPFVLHNTNSQPMNGVVIVQNLRMKWYLM